MAQKKPALLLVDDDRAFLDAMDTILRRDYSVFRAESGEEALEKIDAVLVNCVLLDLGLPDVNGLDLLPKILEMRPCPPVIIVTASKDIAKAVKAIKQGAYDYIDKPPDREKLLVTVRNAVEKEALERERSTAIDNLKEQWPLIGASPAILAIKGLIEKIAPTNMPVLIMGETGTGKEVVARQIHYNSQRAGQTLKCISLPTISEGLLESELFGHEKGAFTGAHTSKPGLFEVADRGTLFLDEIGRTTPSVQSRILRAIELGEFTRLGATIERKIDIRLLCATSVDVKQRVDEGSFLSDLYYRISSWELEIPPLKDRKEDIPVLAEHFLDRECRESGIPRKKLTSDAVQLMLQYDWPGNVRELQQKIKRLAVLVNEDNIDADSISEQLEECASEHGAGNLTLKQYRERCEKDFIEKALISAKNNVTEAARLLGIHRTHLSRKIRELGIKI